MSEYVFDLMILFILLVALYRGASRGFVWQLATIAAIIFCFIFAKELSTKVAPVIASWGAKPPLDHWLAMLTLYIGFSFLAFAIARSFQGWLEKVKLKEYDKHLGAAFGLVKGIVFSLVIIFFLVSSSDSALEMIKKSYSGKAAAVVMNRLHPVMPPALDEALHKFTDLHALDQPGLDLKKTEDGHVKDDSANSESSDLEDPFGNFDPFNKPAKKQEGQLDFLANFVKALPGAKDNNTQNSILDILKNSTPAQRDKMMETLRNGVGVSDFIKTHSDDFFGSTPEKKIETSTKNNYTNLLNKIAELQSSSTTLQQEIVSTAQTALKGVPEIVANKAVADWHADLYGLEADPDPQTDFSTSLKERIIRQTKAARIPLSSLPNRYQR